MLNGDELERRTSVKSRDFTIATDHRRLSAITRTLNGDIQGRFPLCALMLVGGGCRLLFVCPWIRQKEGTRLIAIGPLSVHDNAGGRSFLFKISADKHRLEFASSSEVALIWGGYDDLKAQTASLPVFVRCSDRSHSERWADRNGVGHQIVDNQI